MKTRIIGLGVIALLPFEAYARGSSNLGGFILIAIMFGILNLFLYIFYGLLFLYSNFIGRVFNLSNETVNSGCFPIICFYVTGFIIIFIGIQIYKSL